MLIQRNEMAKQMNKKINTFRWAIFAILGLGYFFVYFHRLSLPVVANELVRDFQTTASVMGLLGSIYFYCYAAMQIPAGLLSDSLGPRKTVTFSLLIASVGSILFGMAGGLGMAFAGRVMVGLGVSMVFIPTMKITSRWFRADEFALMMGLLGAIGGAGALGATWVLALMTGLFGWRVSFELIGAATFALLILVWIVVRDRPEDKGWPPLSESANEQGQNSPSMAKISLWDGFRKVISERYFWPLAVWYFFDCGIFFGFGALWSGPYLMHVYGMTRAEAGAILSMIAWGMIGGSPFLGYLSDKVLKSRKKVMVFCSLALALELLFLCVFPSGLGRLTMFVVFLLFALFASAVVVIGFTTTKELFPVEIAGTSVGLVNLFPFLGGAVFMPVLGKILDLYPKTPEGAYSLEAYTTIFMVLLGSSIICVLSTFFMKETFPK